MSLSGNSDMGHDSVYSTGDLSASGLLSTRLLGSQR
jgi:hypothetical protein